MKAANLRLIAENILESADDIFDEAEIRARVKKCIRHEEDEVYIVQYIHTEIMALMP